MCLKDFAADISAFDVKPCHPFLGAAPCLLFELIESLLARTALVAACLWLPSHPVEFLAIKVSRTVNVCIGCSNAFLTFFEIIGVVPTVGVHGTFVKFHDGGAYTVKEIAVVCDEEQGLGLTLQILFEPFYHLQVEVVGRFVEDEEVGIGNEHAGESHTFPLASGEEPHRLLQIGDLQLGQHLFCAHLYVVPLLIGIERCGVCFKRHAAFADEE